MLVVSGSSQNCKNWAVSLGGECFGGDSESLDISFLQCSYHTNIT
jgi:hypothetical protein